VTDEHGYLLTFKRHLGTKKCHKQVIKYTEQKKLDKDDSSLVYNSPTYIFFIMQYLCYACDQYIVLHTEKGTIQLTTVGLTRA